MALAPTRGCSRLRTTATPVTVTAPYAASCPVECNQDNSVGGFTEGHLNFPSTTNNFLTVTFPALPADSAVDYRVEVVRPPIPSGSQIYSATQQPFYMYFRAATLESFMTFTTGGALNVTQTYTNLTAAGFPAVGQRVQLRGEWDPTTDTHSLYWRPSGMDLASDYGWVLAASTVRAGNSITTGLTSWFMTGNTALNSFLGDGFRWYRRVNGSVDMDFMPSRDIHSALTGTSTTVTPLVGPSFTINRNPNIDALTFPGVTGSYTSVPDAAALDIVGDITMIAKLSLTSWIAGPVFQAILCKRSGSTQQSYRLFVYDGTLRAFWSPDGTDGAQLGRQSAPLLNNVPDLFDGQALWVAFTLDVNDGAAGNAARFFTSTQTTDDVFSVTWVQLGGTQTNPGVTSIFNSTSPLEFGAATAGTEHPLGGTIEHVQLTPALLGSGFPAVSAAFEVSRRSTRVTSSSTIITDVGTIMTVNGSVVVPMDSTPDVVTMVFDETLVPFGCPEQAPPAASPTDRLGTPCLVEMC